MKLERPLNMITLQDFVKLLMVPLRRLHLQEPDIFASEVENVRLAMKTLGGIGKIEGIQSLGQEKEIGGIIASYLVGEEAWGKMTKKGEEEEQEVEYLSVNEDEGTEIEIEENVE